MKRLLTNKWFILGVIVLVAIVLRFWQLGQVPISPDWDEVSLGYNAYSILHTGKDEYGKLLPVVMQSYGDYKPALYSYLSIPSIMVFGLNVFAVRLPSAVFGILTVIAVFFLVRELFKKDTLALLVALFLSLSPWHIQFSRVAFESNVGLAFNVFAALFFLKGLKKYWLLPVSAVFFALNLYVYQSEKVFTPLLFLLLVALFIKEVWKLPKKVLLVAALLGLVVVLPMVSNTFLSKNGLARAQGVSIFAYTSPVSQMNAKRYLFNKGHHDILGLVIDNGRLMYIKQIANNYFASFDLNWLFITGDISRHHAPNMGLLYLWEMPFLFIGLYQLVFGKFPTKSKLFVFGWFLLAPVPAAFTMGVPHAVRSLNFLPTFQIFVALGVLQIAFFLKRREIFHISYGKVALVLLAIVALFNVTYYLDQYFVQLNYFDAMDWQYGYAQLVPATQALSKPYKTIVVTDKAPLDQSYMYFLFYLKYNPALYQKESQTMPSGLHHFAHYVFRPIDWNIDKTATNTLFVGDASDFPAGVSGTLQTVYTISEDPLAKIVGR